MAEEFDSCPKCGRSGEYRNIYRHHFFFCDEHRITWLAGSNLFSSWREEDEDDWRAAWEKLQHYRVGDPRGEEAVGAPLGEQTSLQDLVPNQR